MIDRACVSLKTKKRPWIWHQEKPIISWVFFSANYLVNNASGQLATNKCQTYSLFKIQDKKTSYHITAVKHSNNYVLNHASIGQLCLYFWWMNSTITSKTKPWYSQEMLLAVMGIHHHTPACGSFLFFFWFFFCILDHVVPRNNLSLPLNIFCGTPFHPFLGQSWATCIYYVAFSLTRDQDFRLCHFV